MTDGETTPGPLVLKRVQVSVTVPGFSCLVSVVWSPVSCLVLSCGVV